jgi:hypothetical protein
MSPVSKVPSVHLQAYDELRRFTAFIPHHSLIEALIYDPPEINRPLSLYEQQQIQYLASLLNQDQRNDARKIIDDLIAAYGMDRTRLETRRDALIETYTLTVHERGSHRLAPETEGWLDQRGRALPQHQGLFGDRLEEVIAVNFQPHGLHLMSEELCGLSGDQFKECADAILARIEKIRNQAFDPTAEKSLDRRDYDWIAQSFAHASFQTLEAKLREGLRAPGAFLQRYYVTEFALAAYESKHPWGTSGYHPSLPARKTLVEVAGLGLAQIRADCRTASSDQVSDRFRRHLSHYRQHVRALNLAGSLGGLIRQLLQLLRVINVPVVEPSLAYWGNETIRQSPCDLIALDLIQAVHTHARVLGDEDAATTENRYELALFCLGRLQKKKGVLANEGRLSPDDFVEGDPYWRIGYLRAIEALGANPEGKGHRTLHWLQHNDPDDTVRKTAAEVYPVLRQGDGTTRSGSPRRPFITAIWWLLQAHLRSLGVEPDLSHANLTREAFLRRTNERQTEV